MFWELKILTYLDLDNNEITILPKFLFRESINLEELYLQYNEIISLEENLFRGLINLKLLYLEGNKINSLDESMFNETILLKVLNIASISLTYLPTHTFRGLHDLKILTLSNNPLWSVPYDLFWGLRKLQSLHLAHNKIKSLRGQAFYTLKSLQKLYLDRNQLVALDSNLFQNTTNLRMIDLSKNMLSNIPDMSNLKQLVFLNLKENKLINIVTTTLSTLPKHTELIVSQYEICQCYVPADINCTAGDDRSPFLTCDRLLSNRGLVAMMWLIGLNAFGGNIFVLFQRKIKTENNKVQTFLLGNLALSDLYTCYSSHRPIFILTNNFPCKLKCGDLELHVELLGQYQYYLAKLLYFCDLH